MFKNILPATALLVLAGPAFAGSLTPPSDPVVAAPPAAAPVTGHDWSGLYGGLGYASLGATNSVDYTVVVLDFAVEDGTGLSYFLGYRHDFGKLVLGLELGAYPEDMWLVGQSDPQMGITDLYDVKLTLGYDLGRAMPYLSAGYSFGTYTSDQDYDLTGFVVGAGIEFAVTDHILLGAEYTYRELSADIGGGVSSKFDPSGFALRLTYQF